MTWQLLLESAAEVFAQELALLAGVYIMDVSKKRRCPLKNTFELRLNLERIERESEAAMQQ
jgi:hypothetical protein